MPQEKGNEEAAQGESQNEGQAKEANVEAAGKAQQDEVQAYGEPTDGSGGGGDDINSVP